MKRAPIVTVTAEPEPAVARVIGEGLRRYNAEHSGIDDRRPLAVVVSDPDTREVLAASKRSPKTRLAAAAAAQPSFIPAASRAVAASS